MQHYYSSTLRLLTILQKFQLFIQILPIHRDQSHDHVAVTCQIITQMNEVRQQISTKINQSAARVCACKSTALV